jgi:basic membrane lipoprotein Med (substrate-binding protein (PBP1-ABC) superfamily)
VRHRLVILSILILFALTACGGGQGAATATAIPTDTAVVPPTLTTTPATPLAILVLPADLHPDTSNLYQKTVYDLAQASGFRFQVRNTLTAEDLEPGLQVVIALPPDPGIAALAAAAPQVQFLAINIPEVAPAGNVSVLGNNSQTDVAAFLAGYTAAMITDDYRIGMMMPKDNPDALRALNAFATGMRYYCGACRPLYFYSWTYPQYVEIPAEEEEANYDAWADILIQQYDVGTVFLLPEIATAELELYIGTTGAYMIGTKTPEQLPAGWVMTIQPDIIQAIQNAWPGLISGQGGVTVQSPLGLSDIDPTLLSPGKQRLVEQVLNDLQAGLISTGANP